MGENSKKIRHYLLRCIAESNKTLSKIINRSLVGEDKYTNGFNNLLLTFSGGSKNDVLAKIKEDISSKHLAMRPHNYFDIDTLYAYLKYLDSIIIEVDKMRRHFVFGFNGSQQFITACKMAHENLIRNEGCPESGFYSLKNPIKAVYEYENGRMVLSPLKALSEVQFEKKYNASECKNLLDSYLDEIHQNSRGLNNYQMNGQIYFNLNSSRSFEDLQNHANEKISKQSNLDSYYDMAVIKNEDEYIVYKNKKYKVEKKDVYRTYPSEEVVYVIYATRPDGYRIMGTFGKDKKVYIGDVFDNEGNLVFDESQSGVDEYVVEVLSDGANHDRAIKKKKAYSKSKSEKVSNKEVLDKDLGLSQVMFLDDKEK